MTPGTDWLAKYAKHLAEAERLYDRYHAALAAVEEWENAEIKKWRDAGKDPRTAKTTAAQQLSGGGTTKDWWYATLVGARNAIREQLQIETEMATMYGAALQARMRRGT